MSKWMHGYRRLKKENERLKQRIKEIQQGIGCVHCIDMKNGTCSECGMILWGGE